MLTDRKGNTLNVGDRVTYHGPGNTVPPTEYLVEKFSPNNIQIVIKDIDTEPGQYVVDPKTLELIHPLNPPIDICVCDTFTVLLITGCRCGHLERERRKERNQA